MTAITFPKCNSIILKQQKSVLYIWLNNPKARNALSEEMMAEIHQVLDILKAQRSIRTIVMRGTNGIFCAGGDIKSFKNTMQNGMDLDEVALANRLYGTFLTKINEQPQVVIMLLEGAAFGGGFGLACVGDITFATADTQFRLSETSLGIPPAQISPFVVQRIGVSQSRKLMLTGTKINGVEAEKIGLVHQVANNVAEMEQQCSALLKDISRCAPNANAVTKQLIFSAVREPTDTVLDKAAKAFANCMVSDEGKEGVTAFLEKRSANWNDL